MKRIYMALISVFALCIGAESHAWTWGQLNPVNYLSAINVQAWNPFAKNWKKPVMNYEEYRTRVLGIKTDKGYNPDARLEYFKCEKEFLNDRKEWLMSETSDMSNQRAYFDKKIDSLNAVIAHRDLEELVKIEDNLWRSAYTR